MALKAEMEELESNKVVVKVEVPAEDVKKAVDKAFRDLSREVFIPGFRKGKVPRRVLQARLGMEPIYDEVKQSNMPTYYKEALDQLQIEPIDEPEIDIDEIEIEEGKPLVFEATVEVKPRVELEKYTGIAVEKPDEEVTEEEVEQVLANMRDKFAQLEVASGKTLADGDYAMIDFDGAVNDRPIEGGSSRDYMLEVGTEEIWPEFNEELRGKRKGDILDIKVKMPERFPDEEIAGKIASFKVIVKEVKIKKLPDADDDFAKEASRFDTLQELKDDIHGKLAESKRAQAEESVRLQVLEKLANSLDVDIPQKMVEDYAHQRLHDLEARLSARGISLESYLKSADYTEKRLEEEFNEEADRLIRNELVLDAVVKAEGLEVSDDEINEEIEKRAGLLGIKAEDYRAVLEERGGIEETGEDLKHRKALKFLGDHAVFGGEGESVESNAGETSFEPGDDTGEDRGESLEDQTEGEEREDS